MLCTTDGFPMERQRTGYGAGLVLLVALGVAVAGRTVGPDIRSQTNIRPEQLGHVRLVAGDTVSHPVGHQRTHFRAGLTRIRRGAYIWDFIIICTVLTYITITVQHGFLYCF